MTFYNFMIRNYLNGNSAKSDLANDMRSDKSSFPKNNSGKYPGWHKLIYEYLTTRGACHDAILIFEECWKEYLECEKKKSNRSW